MKYNDSTTNPVAHLRDLTPLFDGVVDQWLRHFAGSTDHGRLESCLANITSPDHTILILSGPPATGKTLLAQGTARLWTTTGPTQVGSSARDFKRSIARCPLVVADGELHAYLDRILSSPKVIVTTNQDDVSSLTKGLPAEQAEAIASRTCLVRSRIEAADFLCEVDTRRLVEGDIIARHILWLRENRRD